jgi:hypothetical protein
MNELQRWANFYLLISAAAATLIGLLFAVITFGAERIVEDRTARIRMYLTPTVLDFASVLLLAALLTFPNHTRFTVSLCICLVGVAGLIYSGLFLLGGAIKTITTDCKTASYMQCFHLRHTRSMYPADCCSSMPLNADSPWWPPVCCRCLPLPSATRGPSSSTSSLTLVGRNSESRPLAKTNLPDSPHLTGRGIYRKQHLHNP